MRPIEYIRGFFAFLLCGGLASALGVIADFLLKFTIPYFFYKDEVVTIIVCGLRFALFILMYGLKYVEPLGYVDQYDSVEGHSHFTVLLCGVLGTAGIVPLLCGFGVNTLLPFLWVVFYSPISFLYTFINGTSYAPNSLLVDNTLLIITSFVMLFVTGLLQYPFYFLGRRHCRRDRQKGVKIQIIR